MTFSTEGRPPSCFVDKALIQSLEDYLKQRVRELPEPPDEVTEEANWFVIDVTDKAGTEKMDSIREFGPNRFYDGTSEVGISYHGYHPDLLEIRIRLRKDRDWSRITVTYTGGAAREFVTGLIDGIQRILSDHKTGHSWLHPPWFVKATFLLVAGIFVPQAIALRFSLTPSPSWLSRSFILLAGVLVGYLVLGICKPFSMFDTRRNEMLGRVSNWFVAGLAAFILFTIFGDYLRKWLGF